MTVLRPVLRNKRGNPLLLFKKLLLGDLEKLPLVLKNSGIIAVQVRACSGNALVWELVLVPWRNCPRKHGRPGNRSQKFFKQMTDFDFPGREFLLEM